MPNLSNSMSNNISADLPNQTDLGDALKTASLNIPAATNLQTDFKPAAEAAAAAVIPPISRPSVLSLAIKEKAALYAAYMPFLKNGGVFVPTSKKYSIGDEIYLILSVMEDQQKYPIAGRVVWINFENTHSGKVQGIGVHFPGDETGQKIRARIEEILGTAVHSTRNTHTL